MQARAQRRRKKKITTEQETWGAIQFALGIRVAVVWRNARCGGMQDDVSVASVTVRTRKGREGCRGESKATATWTWTVRRRMSMRRAAVPPTRAALCRRFACLARYIRKNGVNKRS